MRQKKQLELIKDYHSDIKYYPGKANVIVDNFNRKVFISQLMIQREIQIDLE